MNIKLLAGTDIFRHFCISFWLKFIWKLMMWFLLQSELTSVFPYVQRTHRYGTLFLKRFYKTEKDAWGKLRITKFPVKFVFHLWDILPLLHVCNKCLITTFRGSLQKCAYISWWFDIRIFHSLISVSSPKMEHWLGSSSDRFHLHLKLQLLRSEHTRTLCNLNIIVINCAVLSASHLLHRERSCLPPGSDFIQWSAGFWSEKHSDVLSGCTETLSGFDRQLLSYTDTETM